MKASLIKELHAMGVYRSPKTKQKLETMKMTEILEVLNWVEEEKEKGTEFKKEQCKYEFIRPVSKQEKLAAKAARGKKR